MRHTVFATFCISMLLTLALGACPKEQPPAPLPPPSPPIDPYISDNDETYVPMNYYY